MLKLTYGRKSNKYERVTVLGDAYGIRDLYWQLTRNHSANDGTAIGEVKVSTIEGFDITDAIMTNPHGWDEPLSWLQR